MTTLRVAGAQSFVPRFHERAIAMGTQPAFLRQEAGRKAVVSLMSKYAAAKFPKVKYDVANVEGDGSLMTNIFQTRSLDPMKDPQYTVTVHNDVVLASRQVFQKDGSLAIWNKTVSIPRHGKATPKEFEAVVLKAIGAALLKTEEGKADQTEPPFTESDNTPGVTGI